LELIMMAVTEAQWRDLVDAYEAAVAASDEALETVEADRPSVAGSVEEAAYDRCWAASVAAEDRLLDVVAPNLDAVAYQLRVFAERFHQVDLAQRTGAEEIGWRGRSSDGSMRG